MALFTRVADERIVGLLAGGGIGVLRTDTLYGIVARADDADAVGRVYEVKGRTPTKPPIILIGSMAQLFDHYDPRTVDRLGQVWPGKVSIILPAPTAPQWLRRDGDSLAYRLPDDATLRTLLNQTGPLIAPSANPEGEHPAMTIAEAEAYFGDRVDFYVDGGTVADDTPSRLYRLLPTGEERLR